MTNYKYITDFHKSRAGRIGASDVPALIPHPIKQVESLAAYTDDKHQRHAMTALDLYNAKINNEYSPSGFQAEIGHWLEGKAIHAFITDNIDNSTAKDFLRGYMMHKIEQDNSKEAVNPEPYNNTPFKHNTEVQNDYGVAHADCVYDPSFGIDMPKWFLEEFKGKSNKGEVKIKSNGLIIDLTKPFLIEAKTANYFSARRKEDPYTGYDLDLHEWHGVPLKVYMQTQFQMHLYKVDVCYVVLIFNTSSKHYWQIKYNKKHATELEQLAQYMKKCIDEKTPPKNLLMNAKDIQALFPAIQEDFKEIKGDELNTILKIAIDENEASEQEKIWKRKKEQCAEMMAIHLKDTKVLKGNVGGMIVDIARWKETGGSERVMGLGDIGKRDDADTIIKYLKKKKLIKTGEPNLKPDICIKKKDLEEIEIIN
jgi:hypothetical protein